MSTRPRPLQPASFQDLSLPNTVETIPEFNALPHEVKKYALMDWVWCMDHDAMRGQGLFSHYGFLRWDLHETIHEADTVPGVTLNGREVRRSECRGPGFLYGG